MHAVDRYVNSVRASPAASKCVSLHEHAMAPSPPAAEGFVPAAGLGFLPCKLSDEQTADFFELGYLVLPPVLTTDATARCER